MTATPRPQLTPVFFVSYVAFEVPSNLVLKKFRPSRWIPFTMVGPLATVGPKKLTVRFAGPSSRSAVCPAQPRQTPGSVTLTSSGSCHQLRSIACSSFLSGYLRKWIVPRTELLLDRMVPTRGNQPTSRHLLRRCCACRRFRWYLRL